MERGPTAPLTAGTLYFALAFAAGFVLGTIRVLAVVPAVGETLAVLIELPIMLTVSWIACGFVIRRLNVPATVHHRIVMGAAAFTLLMIAEVGVAWLLGRRSVSDYLTHYTELAGALGLAGQIVFATFPLLRLKLADKAGS